MGRLLLLVRGRLNFCVTNRVNFKLDCLLFKIERYFSKRFLYLLLDWMLKILIKLELNKYRRIRRNKFWKILSKLDEKMEGNSENMRAIKEKLFA